jgi:exodeoxyribonuclease-5
MSIKEQMTAFILEYFGFEATSEQQKAAKMISSFIFERDEKSLFLLKGYAGTGKTSLVGAVVQALDALKQRTVLMAPTGRAAKVFSRHASHPAFTIHKRIYRQKSFSGEMVDFMQNVNLMKDALFIVDEASMIANDSFGNSAFGTGRLLDDLIQFVYSGHGCRLMLVGDTAQLPPVGEEMSPALEREMLEGYGLKVEEMTLTQVVRQLDDSGILWNATMLRRLMAEDELWAFPQLRLKGFADVVFMPGNELIEAIEQAYYQVGQDETIVVTRSNVRANAFNQGIRSRILGLEEELTSGDQVMVVKNNYHWVQPNKADAKTDDKTQAEGDTAETTAAMDFIANGDVAVVRRFRNERRVHDFRFADVTLQFPDYDDTEVEATMLLDTLSSEAPALTREEQEKLFQHVWDDYPELTTKRDRMKAVKEDPFFNALQVKYAYAVTCHKAQGGQWQRVFLDQGFMTEEMLGPDYFRWLYTAITRATETVYLVNLPKGELDDESRRLVGD